MTTKPKTAELAKSEPTTLPAGPGATENKQAPEKQDVNLIPVTEDEIGGVKCMVVDARSLHKAMGSRRDFTTWIKSRIIDYSFTEGEQYERDDSTLKLNRRPGTRGGDRRSQKYTLSLGMAKELAMLEKTDMGRTVRRYFIQREKDLLTSLAQSQKALPVKKDEKFKLKDWNGKPYEKNPIANHVIQMMILLGKGPRKAAYIEYARALSIVGESKKSVAEEMAEGAYDEGISLNIRKLQDHQDMFPDLDLNAMKSMLEKEGLI